MTSATDSVNSNWSYTYDAFNRLATAATPPSNPTLAYSYAYDRFGNRWNQTVTTGTGWQVLLSFNGNNQISSSGYQYDAAGNLLMDGLNCYTYDAENRLSSVAPETAPGSGVCGATTMSYLYDPEGRRVARLQNGSIVKQYYYDASGHMIVEANASGNWLRAEIYAGDRHLATWASNATYFNHADLLGTERARSNSSGARCETIASLPFGDGQTIAGSCGDPSPNHFTGKERDPESGLDYFGARYYGSNMGRFETPDPLLNSGRPWQPQSWNRYAYSLNNPLKFIDPTGLYDLVNTCAQDEEKCNKQFRRHADDLKKGLLRLQNKVDKIKDPVQKARLQAALTAMGTEGDKNGVNVSFGTTKDGGAGETDPVHNQQTDKETYNVTLDPNQLSGAIDYAIAGAHEGTHIDDLNIMLANPNGTILSLFSYEYRGYQTSAFAVSALGGSSLSMNYDGKSSVIWNGSWGEVDKNITSFVTSFHDKNGQQTHPETTPHNPWPN
jgi:RHS repeat-associated protein